MACADRLRGSLAFPSVHQVDFPSSSGWGVRAPAEDRRTLVVVRRCGWCCSHLSRILQGAPRRGGAGGGVSTRVRTLVSLVRGFIRREAMTSASNLSFQRTAYGGR